MPPKRKAPEAETPRTGTTSASASANTGISDTAPALSSTTSAVATVSTAPVKRQRVSRACDQCRAAREKCDGIQPLCFPCVSQNRPCTYRANPKKRGVQTGYIRTLELALSWIFENVSGSEDALHAVLSHEGGRGQTLLAGNDAVGAERLHKKWRKSRVHKGIDSLLSGGIILPPLHDKRSQSEEATDSEGEITGTSPGLTSTTTPGGATARDTLATASFSPPAPTESLGWQAPAAQKTAHPPQDTNLPASVSSGHLKLPPNHWRLLDIYFSYTHSWLPILQKQDLYQASYLYSDEGLPISHTDPSAAAHAELWSALALAAFQDAANSTTSSSGVQGGIWKPEEIYRTARSLIPHETGAFHIQHCRSLLLLSLVNLGRGNLGPAWLLVGQATRVFLDIDARQSPNRDPQQQRQRALLIACFMIDTIVSLTYDRPAHLRPEDVADELPLPEDGVDQWEPWTPCDGFGAGFTDSRVSRNPAYCSSTFNQIFGILKVVATEMAARRQSTFPRGQIAYGFSRLQQVVNGKSPFSTFVLSPSVGPASVPTAYLVRAIYLWASALLEPTSEVYWSQIRDTLRQYEVRFGACVMAPFIPSCIASLTTQHSWDGPTDQHKQRLPELLSRYTSIWDNTVQDMGRHINANPHTEQIRHRTPTSMGAPRSVQMQVPSNPATFLSQASPYYNASDVPTPPSRSSTGEFGSFNASGMLMTYQHHTPGLNGPSTGGSSTAIGGSRPSENNSSDMYLGGNMHGVLPHTLTPSQPPTHMPSTGLSGTAIDYDALLDDLASIECTDPVDVDPQFMTNLGFAPGCDITEIMSRDFGGL